MGGKCASHDKTPCNVPSPRAPFQEESRAQQPTSSTHSPCLAPWGNTGSVGKSGGAGIPRLM